MKEYDEWLHLHNKTYLAELKLTEALPGYVTSLRRRLELNQDDLARLLGCNSSYISNIERGNTRPRATAPIVKKILSL